MQHCQLTKVIYSEHREPLNYIMGILWCIQYQILLYYIICSTASSYSAYSIDGIFILLDCPQIIAPFYGKHGRIIKGHVSPPLEGVTITLSSEQIGTVIIVTNKDGFYRYFFY